MLESQETSKNWGKSRKYTAFARLSYQEKMTLDRLCLKEDRNRSEILRRALLSYAARGDSRMPSAGEGLAWEAVTVEELELLKLIRSQRDH